jgi:hypothetical protein
LARGGSQFESNDLGWLSGYLQAVVIADIPVPVHFCETSRNGLARTPGPL